MKKSLFIMVFSIIIGVTTGVAAYQVASHRAVDAVTLDSEAFVEDGTDVVTFTEASTTCYMAVKAASASISCVK